MKYIRVVLVTITSIATVGIAVWLFMGWTISRSFQPALKKGGGLRQLADVLQASVGSTVGRGDARLQPGEATGEGALACYQKNPQALQRDKKYVETWHSALAIADAGRKSEHQLGQWKSSTAVIWVAQSQRMDAWGHAFCVQSDQQQTVVLSPGPQALSSLNCNTLKVPEEELARMPQGRLNLLASGALILFVKKPSHVPSAT